MNHSFASLNSKSDYNPFSLAERKSGSALAGLDASTSTDLIFLAFVRAAPAEIRGSVPGFTREESAAFAQEARKKASEGLFVPEAVKEGKH